jgi:hypothetical protein
MDSITILALFIIIYSINWISLFIGVLLIKKGNKSAEKMHELFLIKQIQKFQYPPFKNLLKLWIENKYFPAVFTFIFLIILPATCFYFLIGILLFTPLLIIIQGLTVGILIGNLNGKNMLWAMSVCIFEFGYWALSGTLGLIVTIGNLFRDLLFTDSLLRVLDIFISEYWLLLVICILGNSFLEIAGPIYWNMKGAINLEVLTRNQDNNKNT